MRFPDIYGPITTDTTILVDKLAQPADTGKLVRDFDSGMTGLRDVGHMLAAQRELILEADAAAEIMPKMAAYPEVFSTPVKRLRERLHSKTDNQPVGHNFLVNATGFIDAGLPWAQSLDNLINNRCGMRAGAIAALEGYGLKDQVLEALTDPKDIEATAVMAAYLAGRSLEGEKYLRTHYEKSLQLAKYSAAQTVMEVSVESNLSTAMINRSLAQTSRTTFGSFDHLADVRTTADCGVLGDYLPGTLRVEVLFDGDMQQPNLRNAPEAVKILTHEVHHAASAQTLGRGGLRIKGHGLDVNESMTEYLAQLSRDATDIKRTAQETVINPYAISYAVGTIAMHTMHTTFTEGRDTAFADLFNAYHGDIGSGEALTAALDRFYNTEARVATLF